MVNAELVGIFHVLEMLSLMTYLGWRTLIPSNIRSIADFGYIFTLYLLVLSWLTFSNECIISLLYKKIFNVNEESTADLKQLLGEYITLFKKVYYMCVYVTAIVLFIWLDLVIPGLCFLLMMYVYVYTSSYDRNGKMPIDQSSIEMLFIKGFTLLVTVYAIFETSKKIAHFNFQ